MEWRFEGVVVRCGCEDVVLKERKGGVVRRMDVWMDGCVASAGRVMPSLRGHFRGSYDSVAFKPELVI